MKLRWPVLLLALAVLFAAAPAAAIPAPPFPIPLQNADGTTVTGRLFGDEHFGWAHDLEGYPLAYDHAEGAWHYATLGPEGRFLPLPHRAGRVDPSRLGLVKNLKPSPKALERAMSVRRSLTPKPKPILPRGNVRNLTLLTKFNCASGCSSSNQYTTFTAAQFEPLLNGTTNSAKAYYQEISYGQLTLTSTIANNAWIQLPNNDQYYAYNDQYPNGHPEDLVLHAVRVLDSQGFDFTQFDGDGDGEIDAIHVIHNGPGYEISGDPRCIHSHYMDLTLIGGEFRTHDGILISAYHVEPELRDSSNITMVGVVVHETGHFFGLPDLYDYSGQSAGVGMWSLMAAGAWGGPSSYGGMGDGTKPVHADAWSKYRFGFVTPRIVNANTQGVRVTPAHSNADIVRIDYGMPTKQFFLIENRQQSRYDQYIPASGLAIYHVDENRWFDYCSSYQCNNNDATHYLVDLEQADGQRELNTSPYEFGDAGDVWPYSYRTSFTPTSTPNSLGYNQTSTQGKISLTNIAKQSNGDITFDVAIAGGSSLLAIGANCANGGQCQSGYCVDGFCCNSMCNAGQCDACSASLGATANGYCTAVNVACNDNDNCTTNDRCENGLCHGAPVVCSGGGDPQCSSGGSCNPATGQCQAPIPFADGTPCNDSNLCTRVDSCQQGACVGSNPVQCSYGNPCQVVSACDPATGACLTQPMPDGYLCDDADLCTSNDVCRGGNCSGSPTLCPGGDDCHEPGVCDPTNGQCTQPLFEDGTECPDGTCQSGVCEPTVVPEEGGGESCFGCSAGASTPMSSLFALLIGLAVIRRRAPV